MSHLARGGQGREEPGRQDCSIGKGAMKHHRIHSDEMLHAYQKLRVLSMHSKDGRMHNKNGVQEEGAVHAYQRWALPQGQLLASEALRSTAPQLIEQQPPAAVYQHICWCNDMWQSNVQAADAGEVWQLGHYSSGS